MTANDWNILQKFLIDAAQRASDDGSKTDAKSLMWPIHYGNAHLLAELAKVAEAMAEHKRKNP